MKTDHTWETVAINTGVKHVIVLWTLSAFVQSRSHIYDILIIQIKTVKVLQSKKEMVV